MKKKREGNGGQEEPHVKEVIQIEERVFSDPTIPAFFEAVDKPFTISSQRNLTTGWVEFLVSGQGIDQALEELYSNRLVGALDFIKSLKSFRNSIFALKGGRR